MDERRFVRVAVTGHSVFSMFVSRETAGRVWLTVDVPEGSIFVRWYHSYDSDCMFLVVAHGSFGPVEEGAEPPVANSYLEAM